MTQEPRVTALPPDIPGYTYVQPVGHGGFSDVYLYEQTMPRRQVAIKVLRTDDLSENTREQFAAEANLMARVSNHSNIAAIYAADVDEEGQPYLVMEYCSGGSLGRFYRHYPMSVKDVLTLGVRLAGALEAAHRAGIVHRDIKPANILLTEYGVPVLSDFGISTIDEDFPEATRKVNLAATTHRQGTGESSVGMSLPWAAPETLWELPVSDARSDRYSLAATLYSLLEGHSPHEVPGGPNSAMHLVGRIQRGFVTATRRPDLPPSLQALLAKGLSHDRAGRFDSAADMGRALQDVQRELRLEVTPLEVPRGEIAARPPEVGSRVHQKQPIQLPDGHATLAPPGEGAAPGPPAQPAYGQPGQGAGPAAVAFAGTPANPPSHPQPQRPPWELPPGAQVAPPGPVVMAGTRGAVEPWWSQWRVAYGVLMAVLLVACVVVASLLIAQANSEPTYDGREIDHLEVELTNGGVYTIGFPEALPVPDDVQVRVLESTDGDAVTSNSSLELSTDSAEWLDGDSTSLNPLESANQGGSVYLSQEELSEILGIDATTLHEGDVVLVAAFEGYFSNTHPELGVNWSSGTLVVIKIVDAY